MKWTQEAEAAVSRVPFFVRKRVEKRVEEEAAGAHASEVTLEHVKACQRRFLTNMESEVKGYQVEHCFGASGCPNRVADDSGLVRDLEAMLSRANLRAFLKERVQGPLKLHHEFRVSISGCPNACSRPQIVDVGLIGACKPVISQTPCTRCGSCVEACSEGAIALPDAAASPVIDSEKCLKIRVTPSCNRLSCRAKRDIFPAPKRFLTPARNDNQVSTTWRKVIAPGCEGVYFDSITETRGEKP